MALFRPTPLHVLLESRQLLASSRVVTATTPRKAILSVLARASRQTRLTSNQTRLFTSHPSGLFRDHCSDQADQLRKGLWQRYPRAIPSTLSPTLRTFQYSGHGISSTRRYSSGSGDLPSHDDSVQHALNNTDKHNPSSGDQESEITLNDSGSQTFSAGIGRGGGRGGKLRLTSELPTRTKMILDTPGIFPKDLGFNTEQEASREIRQSFGTTYGGNYKLQWDEGPRTVLIIKKPCDEKTDRALIDVATWIHKNYKHANVVVEPDVAEQFTEELPFVYVIPDGKIVEEYTRVTDLVVTLGGDGTILHTSSLFKSAVPPVISFSLGTLGFLLPYHIDNYQAALQKIFDSCNASLLLRMRLKCTLHGADGRRLQAKDGSGRINDLTVMNEVNLHRGRYPHLTSIGCYVDGHLITEAVADGLIVASPTGSTAYSLSAGGSIVHPSIQSLLMTPICPRSLSFRPVLLPPNATIQLKIGESSRRPAEVSLDGKETFFLDKNEFLQVCMSPFPMPCVNRVHASEDWIKDINYLLKWNQGFHNKHSMSHYISE